MIIIILHNINLNLWLSEVPGIWPESIALFIRLSIIASLIFAQSYFDFMQVFCILFSLCRHPFFSFFVSLPVLPWTCLFCRFFLLWNPTRVLPPTLLAFPGVLRVFSFSNPMPSLAILWNFSAHLIHLGL